ncbi:MAG: nuclear transport factor 2 family protein [Steroidobacteraceae bacterium]
MTEELVRRLDDQIRVAMLDGDADVLNTLMAADFVGTNPFNHVVTREHVLEMVRAGRLRHSRFERIIEQVRLWGDTAVVIGHETVADGGGPARERRYTDVWRWQGQQWRLTVRHANFIATP